MLLWYNMQPPPAQHSSAHTERRSSAEPSSWGSLEQACCSQRCLHLSAETRKIRQVMLLAVFTTRLLKTIALIYLVAKLSLLRQWHENKRDLKIWQQPRFFLSSEEIKGVTLKFFLIPNPLLTLNWKKICILWVNSLILIQRKQENLALK